MNTPANPAMDILPKPTTTGSGILLASTLAVAGIKQNSDSMPSTDFMLPTEPLSLAEELGAARRRNEKLRLEKEKTEMELRARDLALENGMKESERRELEQREVELTLQHLLCVIHRRSLLSFAAIGSLSKQEDDKISGTLSMGPNCEFETWCDEDDVQSSISNDKEVASPISVPR